MQKYITIFITSFLSATLAILLFAYVFPRETIIHENRIPGQFVEYEEYLNKKTTDILHQSSQPNDFIAAAESSRQCVVYIRTLTQNGVEKVFQEDLNASSGSGVIISPDGYITTNHHVVANAVRIDVTLNDNREFAAKLIGTDPATDLALIKIESNNLPFALFGNSDSLKVGEWVLAVGNPFRLQSTVTAGIVSAKARNINVLEGQQGIESFIQTDAAVNPGNSGGALVNTDGQLIGINSAIISLSGGYEGFSFAIPSNLARKVIFDIKEYGAVQRGWMGIAIHNLTAEEADNLGLDFVQGVHIDRITNGSAAQDAKLQHNDVIVSVNNRRTLNVASFMEQIGRYRPGDSVYITYYRKKKKYDTRVTLKNQLNTTDYIAVRKDPVLVNLGFELRDLSSEEKVELDTKGVYVVSVYKNSTISETQMAPGFIINKVNDRPLKSVAQLIDILKSQKGTIILEGIYETYPGIFPYTFQNK